MQPASTKPSILPQTTVKDIKQLITNTQVHNLLIDQIQQIFEECLSVIVIYQKLYIKIKYRSKISTIHVDQNDASLYMIKVSKVFPLQNSVRLYLLDGCYEPKISDARDLMQQVLGQDWTYQNRLKDIVRKLPLLEEKLLKRNQNYLALQKTGNFLLGDVFVYNQLEEHTSLSLFVQKNKQNNSILNAVSKTHFLTFQRVFKKVFKSKQQQDYETKSKTLYGKKFLLQKCCDLQCIQSLKVNSQTKQISVNILKYRSIKSFNEFESMTRNIAFNDEEAMRQFIRTVLKNLPQYQPTKISLNPSLDKFTAQSKQDKAVQKVIELNELQNRLQGPFQVTNKTLDILKKQQLINRLNKSYQKMIQFYSARANPYYLIYVNKLNWLYNKYFDDQQQSEQIPINEMGKPKSSKIIKSQSLKY